jgi:VWFA-related protein
MTNRIVTGLCVLTAVLAQEGPVIKTETRLVLVDAVVTNKKGEYVRDLSQKDFKVYEDNHEQSISSFSFEADPASPANNQPRYLVLLFDNSTMDFAHQKYAREAAGKFVQANAGPKRMMAIVEYGASLRVAQNFTDDAERLSQVVAGVKLAPRMTDSNGLAIDGLNRAAASYGTRNSILAIQSLVKNLAGVPGRKSLVLFSGGFRLDSETLTEINLLIDMCNKSNVAVYPIDARGLMAAKGNYEGQRLLAYGAFRPIVPGMTFFLQARPGAGSPGPGAGAGGGGTRSPGGGSLPSTGGGGTVKPPAGGGNSAAGPRGGTTTTNPGTGTRTGGGGMPTTPNANTLPPRALIMPPITPNATDNQQPLYMLANGTGGFVIVNTNDLLGGLDKIGKEQNEHYMIGYSPENFEEGKCHALKVKISQSGMTVRARTGYCDAKPTDLLSGNAVEKDLERIIAGAGPGTVSASMQAPYFYTSPNTTRMNVALEIPTSAVKFEKHKGKYNGQLNILGVVYRPDGGVAARFSDTLKYRFDDKKSMEAWQENPTINYEKDVEGVPGKYTLKMVIGANSNSYAKLELPIAIDPYDGKKFSLSGLAFSTSMRRVTQSDAGLDSAMSEDRTPLIVNGLQLIPSGRNSFKKTETVGMYAELYEPANGAAEPPKDLAAAVQLRLLDAKGQVKIDSGLMRQNLQAGNPVVPFALKIPVDKLEPGSYICELSGADTLGGQFRRVANFTVE